MEEVAGWITFNTKIDDKYFKNGIKKAERNLEKLDKENQKLTSQKEEMELKINIDREQLDKDYKNAVKSLENDYQAELKLNPKGLSSGQEKWFDKQRQQIDEEYAKSIDKMTVSYDKLESKIKENNKAKEEEKKKIQELITKYDEWKKANNKSGSTKFGTDIGKSINVASKKMTSLIKRTVAWGLALLGIRSLYGLLSNAASQLEKTNKQTAVNLQYIKTALATALEPIITWLVNQATKLLQIFNTLVFKLTGKNLFKDAKKNLEGGAKAAGEMRKQLAGFDEMNILSDNSGSSGGGTTTPNVDLGKIIDDKVINEKIDNIKKKADKLATELGKNENWKKAGQKAGLGFFDGLDKYFNSDFYKGWTKINSKILGYIIGFIASLPVKLWNLITGFFSGLTERLTEYFVPYVKEAGGNIWQGLLDGILDAVKNIWNWIKENIVNPFVEGFKKGFGIASPSKVMKELGGYLIDGLKEGLTGIWEKVKEKFEDFKTKVEEKFTKIKDKIIEIWNSVKKWITDKIINPLTDKFEGFKKSVVDIFNKIKDALKGPINTIIGWINKLIDGINKISINIPKSIAKLAGLGNADIKLGFNIKKIPKLAKGGIINMPGKGVPLPLALGGESAPEGVIPLNDAEQMAILGEAIGRYISINLTNITRLDSREISRTSEKVQSNRDFIMNR